MEVRADPGHQRPAGGHPPRRVAVAGINANAGERHATVCFGQDSASLRQGFHGAGVTPCSAEA